MAVWITMIVRMVRKRHIDGGLHQRHEYSAGRTCRLASRQSCGRALCGWATLLFCPFLWTSGCVCCCGTAHFGRVSFHVASVLPVLLKGFSELAWCGCGQRIPRVRFLQHSNVANNKSSFSTFLSPPCGTKLFGAIEVHKLTSLTMDYMVVGPSVILGMTTLDEA